MPSSSSSKTLLILQTGSPLGLLMGIAVTGSVLSATTSLLTSNNSISEASLLIGMFLQLMQKGEQKLKLGNGQCLVDGNEVFFGIKRSTHLRKLMTACCERQSVEFNSIAFLFDGRRLWGEQTPDEQFLPPVSRHLLAREK
nr:uncharacterized protein LOC112012584 isoform X2 [Quercus suber]